jgi:hypothetical protein
MTLQFNALTNSEKADLVSTALIGQCVIGPFWRSHLRPLAQVGWLKLIWQTAAGLTVYEITPEARIVLLTVPDDYHQDFFPLPHDIARMKEKLKKDARS